MKVSERADFWLPNFRFFFHVAACLIMQTPVAIDDYAKDDGGGLTFM